MVHELVGKDGVRDLESAWWKDGKNISSSLTSTLTVSTTFGKASNI